MDVNKELLEQLLKRTERFAELWDAKESGGLNKEQQEYVDKMPIEDIELLGVFAREKRRQDY